jgi:polyferredoxin
MHELPVLSAAPATRPSVGGKWRGRLLTGLCLAMFALVPAITAQFFVPEPQHRYIHVEAFRYGKHPSVIRCNRNDWLHLTFSTKDTAHSFFLQEFDIDAKITPGSERVAVFRTSEPELPPKIHREVVIRADHPGWLRYVASKSLYRCHVWCGPMHAFEHGNLIIRPNTLLYAALGLLAGIPCVGLVTIRRQIGRETDQQPPSADEGWDVFRRFPWLKRAMQRREFQAVWIVAAAVVLYIVILTSLFGTHVAGRNFGVMIVWVVWMFLLTAILTPLFGRSWCLVCPLPLFGDLLQRGTLAGVRLGATKNYNNHFLGFNWSWPAWAANDWPRMLSFVLFGTFSSALVAHPPFSGLGILGLAVLATILAPFFELRAFCRYLCPVTGFLSIYGRNAKLALRVADPQVCADCKVHTCQLGSAKGWACPFGLCAADIHENNDCGMCTECIKTCAYDNVTLKWRPFAQETHMRSAGEAWLAMAMLTMGTTYSLVHLGHWPHLRDMVNILDKGNWGLFAVFTLVLWTLVGVVVPGIMLLAATLARRLASISTPAFEVMKASTGTLLPLGIGVWIAFVIPMLTVNVTFVWQSLSDPFGWGWNLLGAAGSPWQPLFPRFVPWLQVGFVLGGLSYGLRNAWRIWWDLTDSPQAALRGMLPVAGLLLVYSGCMVWFFAN